VERGDRLQKGNEMVKKSCRTIRKIGSSIQKNRVPKETRQKIPQQKMEKQVSLGSSFSEGAFHHSKLLP
jgi:hypothetical protein